MRSVNGLAESLTLIYNFLTACMRSTMLIFCKQWVAINFEGSASDAESHADGATKIRSRKGGKLLMALVMKGLSLI